MANTALYHLQGINCAAGFISQIRSATPMPNINVQKGIPAGLPGARFIYNLNQSPQMPFGTDQIKTILDACGTGMVSLASSNADLYFQPNTNLASRTSGSNAIRLRAAYAALIPQSLRADNDNPAQMECRIVCVYDGTNEPLVPAGSQALAGTSTHAEHFVCGPVSINIGAGAVALNGVQSIAIDFGAMVIEQRADGELYITWLCEKERLPSITITTTSNPWVSFGLNGKALTAANVWLRKCAATARVANGTAEHILFSGSAGLVTIQESSGGGNDPSLTTIKIDFAMPDAATAPLLVDTTAAIS